MAYIQGDPAGKVSILGGDGIGHCEKKSSYECVRKEDTRDQLLSRILDAADRIKKGEDQLRRTTRCLRIRMAKCTVVVLSS
jgi:hypothetical protein